jgi:hypothetical protein
LALAANRTALVIGEPQTPLAELFANHPAFFAQVIDDLELALIHPSGNSGQYKPERMEHSWHFVASLSTARAPGRRNVLST